MKRVATTSVLARCIFIVSAFILISCAQEQIEPDPIKSADCEYYFINEPIGNCGFDLDEVPYCVDCPDEEGKLGTYNILIDQPNDSFSESVPLRPTILAVHGYLPNTSEPVAPYAVITLNLMRSVFCKYGYSIAALQYRQDVKGFGESPVCELDPREIVKTHYRAIQDLRLALNKIHENPEEYGIDIDNLFLFGNSQGGMAVLNGIFATNEDEWLGTLPTEYQDLKDELGPWMPRKPVKGIISIAAPLYGLELFDASDNVPLFLSHGVCDVPVPYKSGTYFDCPFDKTIYGSYAIACRAKELGKPYSLYSVKGLGHDYTEEINDELRAKIREWVKDQVVCGTPTQEEFTLTANEVDCTDTSTSLADCQ